MKHKLEGLQNLVKMIGTRSADRMKSSKKPIVSIEIAKHDELPEEDMLKHEMEKPMDASHEEGELAISDDKDGRRAMAKRFGK